MKAEDNRQKLKLARGKCLRRWHGKSWSQFAPQLSFGMVGIAWDYLIIEGNYLLLEDGVWKEILSLFDEKWFIDIDIDKAMQRVLKRHISIGKPPDIAKQRIENNDRINGELIMKSKKNADIIINSVDF
ncbi:P-loop nucleoside triphosphate hydrolase superfamily protein, putative [Medicago truncatula]|uniref:P-loop nucleoside triphosphate hydrolase superfamily protein, putative n=1 Tax=Medicago truncatula TaxID=3880 RepID=A0A072TT29_MEDTR|nr:P-loop nucleoside triphosphate hydrolase superfamily protein, putative [Medicago truncatula]